ncbi:hypothetical protein TEA_013690 [Camellia sinensis var. sinensis]|uniref:Uncharacterized protein n=1 Tax=Camellia sinensis var. sinensis TaxID=542762 RepID=A0A4S4EUA8_CAMSN|nr:hypothetical protein TEA_013690 [Camellia sinensis var. sinensis]
MNKSQCLKTNADYKGHNRNYNWNEAYAQTLLSKTFAYFCSQVLALRGSYHGDTLGAMEAQAPSSYTGFLQQPWYTGRGFFLDPPTVFMQNGVWKLSLPERMNPEKVKVEDTSFSLRDEIFYNSRDGSSLAGSYSSYITRELSLHSGLRGFTHIGSLIIEPVRESTSPCTNINQLIFVQHRWSHFRAAVHFSCMWRLCDITGSIQRWRVGNKILMFVLHRQHLQRYSPQIIRRACGSGVDLLLTPYSNLPEFKQSLFSSKGKMPLQSVHCLIDNPLSRIGLQLGPPITCVHGGLRAALSSPPPKLRTTGWSEAKDHVYRGRSTNFCLTEKPRERGYSTADRITKGHGVYMALCWEGEDEYMCSDQGNLLDFGVLEGNQVYRLERGVGGWKELELALFPKQQVTGLSKVSEIRGGRLLAFGKMAVLQWPKIIRGGEEKTKGGLKIERLAMTDLEHLFIQGSGGMLMVDPLFQRVLVKECQSRKIPVIFDEVFTGFWRLGVESAAELLCCQPDIACFAKLMTGGIVPLAATLATDAVFDAFVEDSKLKALLHGHSYTAHAMGCTAAAKSIKWFKDTQTNFNLISEGRLLKELWDMGLVQLISSHRTVHRVVVLGTLCALELRAEGSNIGYYLVTSTL